MANSNDSNGGIIIAGIVIAIAIVVGLYMYNRNPNVTINQPTTVETPAVANGAGADTGAPATTNNNQ